MWHILLIIKCDQTEEMGKESLLTSEFPLRWHSILKPVVADNSKFSVFRVDLPSIHCCTPHLFIHLFKCDLLVVHTGWYLCRVLKFTMCISSIFSHLRNNTEQKCSSGTIVVTPRNYPHKNVSTISIIHTNCKVLTFVDVLISLVTSRVSFSINVESFFTRLKDIVAVFKINVFP